MKKVYLLSIFMALVAGIAVYLFASNLQAGAQKESTPTNKVVVAVVEIPANTIILEDMVTVVELQRDAVNPYALNDLGNVVGKTTKFTIFPQEQVLSTRLIEKGTQNDALSYQLEEGKRAISVEVDSVSGVSGYIEKGDYVDVVATVLRIDDAGVSQTVSVCLVENLLVLEAGVKQVSSETTAQSYATVTLSVTPEQALMINYAATNGKLRLLLRPVLDNTETNPKDYPN